MVAMSIEPLGSPEAVQVDAWQQLADRLVETFPSLEVATVARELAAARRAVERMSLSASDSLAVAELIARYQLLAIAGILGSREPIDGTLAVEVSAAPAG